MDTENIESSHDIKISSEERISSHKIKAKFFRKNNTFVFIRTTAGRVYQGTISKLNEDYFLIDDIVSGKDTIVTFLECEILDKHKNKPKEEEKNG